MGKGHRLLKKVKSERSKVKIKGSKHLPKGTNVTDTNFKVKQIVIPQQLKTVESSELVTRRKLNIKDLLTRVQHYNTTVRTDAINGLKELVKLHSEQIIEESLHQLLHGVAPLVLDAEKTVRRESLKLLSLILSPVPVDNIYPFFEILCSYLKCGMTHINTGIQEDSLKMLDILLKTSPDLVANSASKILPPFCDLISKLKSENASSRTLTISLGNKITGISWRIKVLKRLHDLFNVVVAKKDQKGISRDEDGIQGAAKAPVYVSNKQYVFIDDGFLSFRNTFSSTVDDEDDIIFFDYINVITPMLFETWIEVRPFGGANANNADLSLNYEALTTLNLCLTILELFWRFFKIHDSKNPHSNAGEKFNEKYQSDYNKHFRDYFPFYQHEVDSRDKNSRTSNKQISHLGCVKENLLIIDLFCKLNLVSYSYRKSEEENIPAFMCNCLEQELPEYHKELFATLRSLLIDSSCTWRYNLGPDVAAPDILESAIDYYNNHLNENQRYKSELLHILCDVINLRNLNENKTYEKWLGTLPNLLLHKEINERTIEMLWTVSRKKNSTFISAVVSNFHSIVENLPRIEVVNCTDRDAAIRKLISMFYDMPVFTPQKMYHLMNFLKTTQDINIKKYFFDVLKIRVFYRLGNQNRSMCSVIMAGLDKELQSFL